MKCPDCKGAGRIVLFTSVADCTCMARRNVVVSMSCDTTGMKRMIEQANESITRALVACGKPRRYLRGE